MMKTAAKVLTVDELAQIGAADRSREPSRHADVVKRAHAAAKAITEALPRWLAAIEEPGSIEAYRAVDDFLMLYEGRDSDVQSIVDDAVGFMDDMFVGLARLSHGAIPADDCPVCNSADGCTLPVARGHKLCWVHEAVELQP